MAGPLSQRHQIRASQTGEALGFRSTWFRVLVLRLRVWGKGFSFRVGGFRGLGFPAQSIDFRFD